MNIKIEDELEKKENIEKVFTGAFDYCLNFMKGNNDSYNDTENNPLTQQSFDYGQEMFEFMLQVYTRIRENTIAKSEDDFKRPYFYQQKIAKEFFDINKKKSFREIESVYVPELKLPDTSKLPSPTPTPGTSVVQKSKINGYKSSSRARKIVNNYKSTHLSKERASIPYEEKLRIVNIARKHPSWSQRTLALYSGCKYIRKLSEWKKLVDQGGPKSEKIKVINKFVYEKCINAKNNNQLLNNELIKKWALEAKKIHFGKPPMDFDFIPGENWLGSFKKTYNIEGRNFVLKISDPGTVDGENVVESSDTEALGKSIDSSSSLTKVHPPKRSNKVRTIPYEKKAKAVELAVKHPTWTLKRLARNCGLRAIKSHSQIRLWTTQLQQRAQILQEISGSRPNLSTASKPRSQNLSNGIAEKQSPVSPEKNLRKSIGEQLLRCSPKRNVTEMNGEKKGSDVVDEDCHRGTVNEDVEMEVDVKPSPEDLHISSTYSLASSQPKTIPEYTNGVTVKSEPVDDDDEEIMIICHKKSM